MAALIFLDIASCPTARFLHVPCPGCGMTRASLALLRGDFVTSFQAHPMGFILLPALGLYTLAHGVSYIRHGVSYVDRIITGKWSDRGLLLLLAALVLVWVVRFFGAFGGPVPV